MGAPATASTTSSALTSKRTTSTVDATGGAEQLWAAKRGAAQEAAAGAQAGEGYT